MLNTKFLSTIAVLVLSLIASAQPKDFILDYIERHKEIAIEEMQRSGVPAAIKLAQGIHETAAGTSDLVQRSNNHFGIKCKSNWTGESVTHDDDARGECFRKYKSEAESYRDHSDFLRNNSRYSFLFNLDPTNFEGWANGLKKAGYATNPKYPQIIIKLIKDYNLQDYTLVAMGKMQMPENALARNDVETDEESGPSARNMFGLSNFPTGVFKINDTRVVFVNAGRSYLSVAKEHDISLSKIFDYNDIDECEVIGNNQLIFLQRKKKTGESEFHVVIKGETLHSIAQEEGIRLECLLNYNMLTKEMQPAPGEKLALKEKTGNRPRLFANHASELDKFLSVNNKDAQFARSTGEQQNAELIVHTVLSNETLYKIAREYNVTVENISGWNNLRGSSLRIGQKLKIYKSQSHGDN